MKRCLSTLLLFLALGVLRGQEIGDVVSLSGDSLRLDRVVELTSDGVVQRDLYGDRIKAKSLFEEALALREDDVAANYQMSILLHGEDAQKALIFAKRAYDADTTNKWSQEQYAQTLLMLGRYDDAQALFRKMIAREDNNPDYYRVLALLYQYTQRPHTAISVLDSAELKVGKNPFLSRIKQGLLLLTHQEQRALDDALEMVANTPYDIQSRLSLADVYVAMGRDSLAE
ncbi:MAG: tetratricopeptide repeat protein, partial [Rikenellaceae bacterium]